jgi:ribosomal protein S18 acetylase RimI-like enzyme
MGLGMGTDAGVSSRRRPARITNGWSALEVLRFRAVTVATLRVARAMPGLVWRAFDGTCKTGAIRAFLRPDNRWFVSFEPGRDDSYAPLLDAVAANVDDDLYVVVEENDDAEIKRLTALGFAPCRREGNFLIPADPAVTGLGSATTPDDIVLISAADVDEDQLRELDDELRQDVPGSNGWTWDPADFREETWDAPDFDPALYVVALDARTGELAGLARVWNSPGHPRLGLIAALRPYRRRGLSRAMLARVFGVLHERGVAEVTAEVDDTNAACLSLMRAMNARRNGGTVEMRKALQR